MKPTKTQKVVLDNIIGNLKFWKGTDDILSPNHYSEMKECMKENIGDLITEHELECITEKLNDLFCLVKYLET